MSQVRFTSPALLKKLDEYKPNVSMSAAAASSVSPPLKEPGLPVFGVSSGAQGYVIETPRFPQVVCFSGTGPDENTGVSWHINGRHAFEANTQFRYFERSRVIVKLVPW